MLHWAVRRVFPPSARFSFYGKCPHSPPQALTQSFGSSIFNTSSFLLSFLNSDRSKNAQLKAILRTCPILSPPRCHPIHATSQPSSPIAFSSKQFCDCGRISPKPSSCRHFLDQLSCFNRQRPRASLLPFALVPDHVPHAPASSSRRGHRVRSWN